MEALQGSTERRAQLDTWMDERRRVLRIKWSEVARRAGMTAQNLLRIRKGQISISWDAADGIEDALRWEVGAVEAAVLHGTKPTPRAPAPQEPMHTSATGDLTDEDEVRLRILKDTIRAEGLTDELRLALLRYLFESAGGKLTPETLDLWLNDPNRLEAIRAAANRNETEQVTSRDRS